MFNHCRALQLLRRSSRPHLAILQPPRYTHLHSKLEAPERATSRLLFEVQEFPDAGSRHAAASTRCGALRRDPRTAVWPASCCLLRATRKFSRSAVFHALTRSTEKMKNSLVL